MSFRIFIPENYNIEIPSSEYTKYLYIYKTEMDILNILLYNYEDYDIAIIHLKNGGVRIHYRGMNFDKHLFQKETNNISPYEYSKLLEHMKNKNHNKCKITS